MALQEKKVNISINGTKLHTFRELSLLQKINEHHSFSLAVDIEEDSEL